MVRVLSIFGTRPEAIKMAPVVAELVRQSSVFDSHVCVTAQHREMLDQVLEFFGITPDVDLNIMRKNQTLSQITSDVLGGLEPVFEELKPDVVLVHGDTTTTMAAALASFYHRIPVGHVEAGLRTNDMYNPFPEEMNRVLADSLSSLHFAPTATSSANLLEAGISRNSVFVTGNTVIDALIAVAEDPRLPVSPVPGTGRLILVTAHRRENFGAPLENACRALREVADAHEDVRIVYPVHLNPNVQRVANEVLSGHERIHLLEPVPYPVLVRLMKDSHFVVTDSGGIQEEAPSLGKPVLVLRNETERPEAVEAGTVRIVGTETETVRREMERLLTDDSAYTEMAEAANPYGDGTAAARTASAIAEWFGAAGAAPFEPFRGGDSASEQGVI
ncbi:UDP-N-acetylglucosamine 2-epimerase (non-hydrolyzing) [bacterium]|nr:UDP-N-acetylglucosamine 2-epimerase (non-hydrolyzing) [bacterium]